MLIVTLVVHLKYQNLTTIPWLFFADLKVQRIQHVFSYTFRTFSISNSNKCPHWKRSGEHRLLSCSVRANDGWSLTLPQFAATHQAGIIPKVQIDTSLNSHSCKRKSIDKQKMLQKQVPETTSQQVTRPRPLGTQ